MTSHAMRPVAIFRFSPTEGPAYLADWLGQRRVRSVVRQIALAGKKAHERAALARDMIANRAAQNRIASFERVDQAPLGCGSLHVQLHFAVHARERA